MMQRQCQCEARFQRECLCLPRAGLYNDLVLFARPSSVGPIMPSSHAVLPPEAQAVRELSVAYEQMSEQIGRVIVGQKNVAEQLLMALFSRGHCLLEGVPGLAKTLLVSTVAKILHLSFKRIQFTPDLMPADITGTDILQDDPETGR